MYTIFEGFKKVQDPEKLKFVNPALCRRRVKSLFPSGAMCRVNRRTLGPTEGKAEFNLPAPRWLVRLTLPTSGKTLYSADQAASNEVLLVPLRGILTTCMFREKCDKGRENRKLKTRNIYL